AAMSSSPTLNVIVLTMLFAFFPVFMGVIKIGLTVGFILIGIPLLTRFLPAPAPIAGGSSNEGVTAYPLDWTGRATPSAPGQVQTWLEAVIWVVKNVARNLWYVVRTTVPLMLLAGLLGSILVTLVPFESLADLLPESGRRALVAMGGLALLGV